MSSRHWVILMTDGYLWGAAPSHAYGLIAFVTFDAGLAIVLWRLPAFGLLGSAVLGVVQFAAMVGDVFKGGPAGLPLALWQQYILADGYFVALLIVQLALITVAIMVFRYLRTMSFTRLTTLHHQ